MTTITKNSENESTPARLIWATPDGDRLVGYLARVSNPTATPDDPADRLINYLIRNRHWSPFEMVNACVAIRTTRDISHQLLRHRSFSFQEFSGRYSSYAELESEREVRLQDNTNRQNSLPCSDVGLVEDWKAKVADVRDKATDVYRHLLSRGVAKEVARVVLPEGLVPSLVYMNGTLRSWIHYWDVRCTPETQKEHRIVAEATRDIVLNEFPGLKKALEQVR